MIACGRKREQEGASFDMKLAETNNLTCRMCKSRKKKVRITLLNKTSSAKLQHFISHQQQQRTGDDTEK
jgi:hypothetical protein